MRRLGGFALIGLGAIGVLLGIALALVFGPDSRIETGPHQLTSDDAAIVTAPQAIAIAGPEVELKVTSTGSGRNLFVGIGHHVDVDDFLDETPRTRVDSIELPWKVTTSPVPGNGTPKAAADDVDWWIATGQGREEAIVSWSLPDSAVDVAILDEDGRDGLQVDVTAAWVAPGIFIVGLALAVLGLGLGVFGWAVLTTRVGPQGLHVRRRPGVRRNGQ